MQKVLTFILFISLCASKAKTTRVVDGDPEPAAPSGPYDAWVNWNKVEGVDSDQDGSEMMWRFG